MSEKLFKTPKVENFFIAILIILTLNIFVNYLRIDLVYDFPSDQIETIFFIQENIPKNSTIIVPDLRDKNYIYDLLIDHDIKFLNNKMLGFYDVAKGQLYSLKIAYLVIDLSAVELKYINQFRSDKGFKILYENDLNIVFKYIRKF